MYAVLVEVDADESMKDVARTYLNETVAPRARELGANAGYWLAPAGGRGVSVVIFDNEDAARALANRMEVGKPPGPDSPEGVTVRSVETREVLASV